MLRLTLKQRSVLHELRELVNREADQIAKHNRLRALEKFNLAQIHMEEAVKAYSAQAALISQLHLDGVELESVKSFLYGG